MRNRCMSFKFGSSSLDTPRYTIILVSIAFKHNRIYACTWFKSSSHPNLSRIPFYRMNCWRICNRNKAGYTQRNIPDC